jgi:hypothetical protein
MNVPGHVDGEQGRITVVVLTWAQRLRRNFGIGTTLCPFCGGRLEVIADVTDPRLLGRTLEHVRREGFPGVPRLAMAFRDQGLRGQHGVKLAFRRRAFAWGRNA